MEYRPQDIVGVTQVVRVVILAAQIKRRKRDVAGRLDMNFPLTGLRAIRGFPDFAAPAEPEAASLLQAFSYCYGESAGCRLGRVGSAILIYDEASDAALVLCRHH